MTTLTTTTREVLANAHPPGAPGPTESPPVIDRDQLTRLVVGGLKSAIHDHGDITPRLISSAAKRIVGQVMNGAGIIAAEDDDAARQRYRDRGRVRSAPSPFTFDGVEFE